MVEKTTYNKEMTNAPALTPGQIPSSYARCFQSDCPMAATCIRFFAGQCLREGQICGPAVYPSARTGNTCKMFKQKRIIRAAYGFKALFAEVKSKDEAYLRRRIKAHLGGNATYYRYHHGERLITPEQQQWIIALFRQYGYEGKLGFDGYRDIYDFT